MESKTDILVEFTDAKGLNYDGMAYEIIRLRRAVEVCKDIRQKQDDEIVRLRISAYAPCPYRDREYCGIER